MKVWRPARNAKGIWVRLKVRPNRLLKLVPETHSLLRIPFYLGSVGAQLVLFFVCWFCQNHFGISKYVRPLMPTYCRPGIRSSLTKILVVFPAFRLKYLFAVVILGFLKLSMNRLRRWALWTRRSQTAMTPLQWSKNFMQQYYIKYHDTARDRC